MGKLIGYKQKSLIIVRTMVKQYGKQKQEWKKRINIYQHWDKSDVEFVGNHKIVHKNISTSIINCLETNENKNLTKEIKVIEKEPIEENGKYRTEKFSNKIRSLVVWPNTRLEMSEDKISELKDNQIYPIWITDRKIDWKKLNRASGNSLTITNIPH